MKKGLSYNNISNKLGKLVIDQNTQWCSMSRATGEFAPSPKLLGGQIDRKDVWGQLRGISVLLLKKRQKLNPDNFK